MTKWSLEHGGEPEEDLLHDQYTTEINPFLGPIGSSKALEVAGTVLHTTSRWTTDPMPNLSFCLP